MFGARVLLTVLLGMLLPTLLMPAIAGSTSLRLMYDLNYTETKSETEDRSDGSVSESETDRLQQTYRVDLSKQLFPTLNLNTGIQVEQNRNNSETVGEAESSTRDQQILPYVDLEWRNPLYSFSGGYRERYARRRGDSISGTDKDYVTSYNLRGEWRPVEFPQLELNYLHSERDDNQDETDSESNTWLVNSRYEYKDYEFRYSFLRGEDRNNINQTETTTSTHNGRIRLNRSFLDGKLNLNAGLRMEYSTQEFTGNETFIDVDRSLSGSGFFLNNSDLNPNDIDPGNYLSFESLNPNPDLRNISNGNNLALGFTLTDSNGVVDRVDLVVNPGDGIVDAAILDAGNWAVYVSDNKEDWTPTISAINVFFDQANNIIEIELTPEVSVPEHIVLIYSRPAVGSPPTGPSVEITAINAVDIVTVAEGTQLTTQVYQAQFGLGWQATDSTRFSYTFNYQERRSSLFDERNSRLNNGLTVIHTFNDIFTGTGRVSAGYRWDQGQLDSSTYNYSARLTGRYLETLNQSLIYSGTLEQDEDDGDGDSTSNSLILRTNAALYEGWDLSFDQGATQQNSDRDGESKSYFVRLQTSLVPHSSYNLIAEYSIDWDQDGDGTERSDTGRLRAFWVPLDTLSFSGEIRLRRSDGDDQLSWESSASWLPLRDGSLQCVLAYSEEEDRDGNRTWAFTPNLTWELTHFANLSLRYSRGEEETNSEINSFETALLNFRIFYD
ncbi:hypothetical protein SAMN02745165_01928 [Malonomonas rubra DSM 5091]|uniref:TIGR03016 family PEP-CTERM system-associated outer membrane protein n=1 Tax=Malonomonas rubra DSM 5091 TaxID=1122189 RepID=A0A1M6HYQ4_MALRU|nr:hypothetical protein [Malonomonas rubra]SHJ27234.1 hypothetical protein SAMN02745165_01928 [Malonomonas rubra DSM 5091]